MIIFNIIVGEFEITKVDEVFGGMSERCVRGKRREEREGEGEMFASPFT